VLRFRSSQTRPRHNDANFGIGTLGLSDEPRSPVGQYAFGVLRNPADDLASGRDIVNEPGILPHRQDGFLDVAALARRLQYGLRFGLALTQCPFPSRPSLDDPVAPRA